MHGTVSHIPATVCVMDEDQDGITIKLKLIDSIIFGKKLELCRVYRFSYSENTFEMTDTVSNIGDRQSPYMIMYHCNMGYPLVTENSIIKIPFNKQTARNELSEKYMDTALLCEKPQVQYDERCYYYDVKDTDGIAKVGIYSVDANVGLVMSFDKAGLDCFTQWKMMGVNDYVMVLNRATATPTAEILPDKMACLNSWSHVKKALPRLNSALQTTKPHLKVTFN